MALDVNLANRTANRGPLCMSPTGSGWVWLTWTSGGATNSSQSIAEEGGDVLLIRSGRETPHIHPPRMPGGLLRRGLYTCKYKILPYKQDQGELPHFTGSRKQFACFVVYSHECKVHGSVAVRSQASFRLIFEPLRHEATASAADSAKALPRLSTLAKWLDQLLVYQNDAGMLIHAANMGGQPIANQNSVLRWWHLQGMKTACPFHCRSSHQRPT